MMEATLEEIGLSRMEAKVYVSLLKEGPITGGNLARILTIDRSHTYNILKNLVDKGLASQVIKEKKTYFSATQPKNLLNQIHKKELVIKSIIPKLEELEKSKSKQMSVQILEGKDGLRAVLNLLLQSKSKEILAYGGTGKSYSFLEYEMPHFAKKIISKKMFGRIITSEKLREEPFTKLLNFNVKYIPHLTPSSTMIFGDKVSINIFEESPSFIFIDNRSVADSYREYFEFMWSQAKN